MQTPLLQEARTASQPQPARLSSRFSTVMGTHDRQTLIIDLSDDDEEEEEEEEESVHSASDTGPNDSIEPSNSTSLSTSTLVPQSSTGQQSTTLQPIGNPHADTPPIRPQLEHHVDPPFMTDGRGRVVWSSTRNASGRGTATEGRGSRHSRAGSTSAIACPSPGPALRIPNTRGHAQGGQDTQSIDGKVGGVEQSCDVG